MKTSLLAVMLIIFATAVRADSMSYTITPHFDNGDTGPTLSFSLPLMPGRSSTTTVLFNGIEEPNFGIGFFNEPAGQEMLVSCPSSIGCMSADGVWQIFANGIFSGDVNNPIPNAGTWQAVLSPHETLLVTAVDPVSTPEPSTASFLLGLPLLGIWARRRCSQREDL